MTTTAASVYHAFAAECRSDRDANMSDYDSTGSRWLCYPIRLGNFYNPVPFDRNGMAAAIRSARAAWLSSPEALSRIADQRARADARSRAGLALFGGRTPEETHVPMCPALRPFPGVRAPDLTALPALCGGSDDDETAGDPDMRPAPLPWYTPESIRRLAEAGARAKLFETGEGAARWSIEEDAAGRLYHVTGLGTRTAAQHALCYDLDDAALDKALFSAGVSMELRDRYIEQADEPRMTA